MPVSDISQTSSYKSLVIMGVAGCGKTSLAQAVAAHLGGQIIEGDDYHAAASVQKMQANIPLTDSDRADWLYVLADVLGQHKEIAILACSALKKSYRDILRQADPDLRFVFLRITPEEARERLQKRQGHYFGPTLVESQFCDLEPPGEGECFLVLEATKPLATLTQEVVAWLENPTAKESEQKSSVNIQDANAYFVPPKQTTDIAKNSPTSFVSASLGTLQTFAQVTMASCLGIMAISVFLNVVLRYGFGQGIAASEELSRLLFVWMVFIGAVLAYPKGEHMAFLGLFKYLQKHKKTTSIKILTRTLRVLVLVACILLGMGAWQQVYIGVESVSVVLRYPNALLPLPVLLGAISIALMAVWQLIRNKPFLVTHAEE